MKRVETEASQEDFPADRRVVRTMAYRDLHIHRAEMIRRAVLLGEKEKACELETIPEGCEDEKRENPVLLANEMFESAMTSVSLYSYEIEKRKFDYIADCFELAFKEGVLIRYTIVDHDCFDSMIDGCMALIKHNPEYKQAGPGLILDLGVTKRYIMVMAVIKKEEKEEKEENDDLCFESAQEIIEAIHKQKETGHKFVLVLSSPKFRMLADYLHKKFITNGDWFGGSPPFGYVFGVAVIMGVGSHCYFVGVP